LKIAQGRYAAGYDGRWFASSTVNNEIPQLPNREFPRHYGDENDYADCISDHPRSVDLVLLDHERKASQSQE
jgi:hypothetical protein